MAATEDYKLIERFFEFELDEEELIEFEQRLEVDIHFSKRVRAFNYVDEKVDKEFTPTSFREMQKKQQKWKEELKKTPMPITIMTSTKMWQTLAASLALFLVAGGLWMSKMSNSAYYDDLAQVTWEDVDTIIGEEITAGSVTRAGEEKESVSQVAKSDSLLRVGKLLFKENKLEASLIPFQTIIDMEENEEEGEDKVKKDLAYWYQALVYVRMNKIWNARKNLSHIIAEKYPLDDEAKKLYYQL